MIGHGVFKRAFSFLERAVEPSFQRDVVSAPIVEQTRSKTGMILTP